MKTQQWIVLAAAFAFCLVQPAFAAVSITEYPLSTGSSAPAGITTGPDGNIWFTEAAANKIVKMTPAGVITEYPLQPGPRMPIGITVGPDGNLWFTEYLRGGIGRITPAGVITEFPFIGAAYNSRPTFITTGPDGNLWFTEDNGSKIGKITPVGVVTEYPLSSPNAGLSGITVGPDGNLWFPEVDANKIGKMSTSGVLLAEYPLPTPNSQPSSITSGPDGNLWFTEDVGRIGKITPVGIVTEYTVPGAGQETLGSITTGPDGNLWFTEAATNSIGRITVAGAITMYPIPTAGSVPWGIAAGPDGKLWFTEVIGNTIGSITTTGVFSEQLLPPVSSEPGFITAGPDGNLWFTEYVGNRIGKMSVAGVVLAEYPLPNLFSGPMGITAGPDGNLWFTEELGDRIGKITTDGAITEYGEYGGLPTQFSRPTGITNGPDGNLWFTEPAINKIGRITPAGVVTEFSISTWVGPVGIAAGPDGRLWFTADSGNAIGTITTAGVATLYPLPRPDSEPNYGIAPGSDGNMWFTEDSGAAIGKITPDGVVTEFPIPTAYGVLQFIAPGPDGNLWFTEAFGNKIGKISTAGVITEYKLPVADSGPVGITTGPDGNLWFTAAFGNRIGKLVPVASSVLLSVAVTGPGTVASVPPGIGCGADCTKTYAVGIPVTLTAMPGHAAEGGAFTFVGWGGACAAYNTQPACVVSMDDAKSASAMFSYIGAGSGYSRDYVQKAYVAYYGRPADPEGVAYWANRMDGEGRSLDAIIQAFGYSDEFNRRYGGLSHVALVTKIYQQLLGRDPDPGGLAWYVAELEAGRRTLQTITLDVLNGATTPPDSMVVANKLEVASHFTASVTAGCGYGGEQLGVASLMPVTFDPATVAVAKAASDSRCAGETAFRNYGLQHLDTFLPSALTNTETFLVRNPRLATPTQAKLDMLRSPTLASEIRNGAHYVSTSVASSDGRWIPIVAIFPRAGMRSEAAQDIASIASAMPILEDFLGIPYPTGALLEWYGFEMDSRLGEGAIHMLDRPTYEAIGSPMDPPYEAVLGHELSHNYVGNESLALFLELYVYNVIHTNSTDVPSWIHMRGYVPGKSDNAGYQALLDIYQLIGPDAMGRAYGAIYPLHPAYGAPLSDECRQAFINQAPAAVEAQVRAKAARI